LKQIYKGMIPENFQIHTVRETLKQGINGKDNRLDTSVKMID